MARMWPEATHRYAQWVEFEWDLPTKPPPMWRSTASHSMKLPLPSAILSLTIADPDHSDDEERFILLGQTFAGRVVMVIHTYPGERTRIISARIATRNQRRFYEG